MPDQTVSEKLHIQLKIGNELLPITIRRDLEEIFRQAAKNINDKLGRYREAYAMFTPERCVTMTLLDFAVMSLQAANNADTRPYNEAIVKLTEEVEEVLHVKSATANGLDKDADNGKESK